MKFLEVNMLNSIFKEFCMKKQYTRKQIQEAISYWKKQLAEGNYRKINESTSDINDLLQDLMNSERI